MKQQSFGIMAELGTDVLLFIEWVRRCIRRPGAPAEACVPNDSEEPPSRVAPAKRLEVAKRPQRGFLDDVFGVLLVAGQPAGQSIGGVKVRQNDILEAG